MTYPPQRPDDYPPQIPGGSPSAPQSGAYGGSPYPYPQQPQQPNYIVMRPPPTSTAAVVSLIAGILGILVGCCSFGLISVVAIVAGHQALSQTRDGQMAGHGMAIAGMIMGYIVVIPSAILSIMLIFGGMLNGAAGN